MIVLAVVNQKGGVGKTTTAVTLGHGLAIRGYRVLLVDLDPQGQVASILGCTRQPGVYDWLVSDLSLSEVTVSSKRDHLYLVPGNKRTSSAQALLVHEGRVLAAVRTKLPQVKRAGVDYLIIDTAPSIGGLQEAGILAADYVIIPTATNYLSSEGVVSTIATLKAMKSRGWRGRLFGVLPTFFDETTRESADTMSDLRRTFPSKLMLPLIHRATILERSAGWGKTVWETDPGHRAATEYAAVLERIEADG